MIFALLVTIPLLGLIWAAVFAQLLPVWLGAVVTALTVLAWAGVFLWKFLRTRRAAGEIEQNLGAQAEAQAASARPDQQAEVDALRGEFQKAIAALKASKLARGGRNALAVLPWYVIIGPPGAGKSTALRASGLQFPYLSTRGGVRGVGGTRNCDWWLTNEAVLLDTAGRYTTEEQDRDEWLSFLDMLARTRPRKPLNGLIVAVSMSDLGAETEEGAVALAQRIRERIDEVMARLQIVLPAYVLFTKCDLVPGFIESFADLRKQERGQIWGFTVPVGETAQAGELFRERFDELLGVLHRRALSRLGEERIVASRELIWQFPQQMQALGGNLAAFVDTLFQENVYQDSPRFRGVYFTSGTQGGSSIDRILGAMADAFGIRAQLAEEAPRLEPRSYFLRDVFRLVLFPDQHLAVRNAKAVRRETLQRWGIAAAAVLAALFVFTLPLRAYLQNRELVESTSGFVTQATAALEENRRSPRLDVLDPLRERLERLRAGPSWSMRLGMYQGDALLPGTETLYAAAVRKLLAEPVLAGEEERLAAFSRRHLASETLPGEDDYTAAYDRLKLILLLTQHAAADQPATPEDLAWAAQQLVHRWSEHNPSRSRAEAERVTAHAQLYAKLVAEKPVLASERDEKVVREARAVLARVPYSALALQKLVASADGAGFDLTLPVLVGDTISVLRSTGRVRGAFTRQGFEQIIRARLENPEELLETWVVQRAGADGDGGLAAATRHLRSRYFAAYIEEWRRFLEATRVDIDAAGGIASALQELTRGEPALLPLLFEAVWDQTRIGEREEAIEGAAGAVVDRIKRRMGTQARAAVELASAKLADREIGPQDVERAMAGFTAFGVRPPPPPGKAPPAGSAPRTLPIDVYQEQLVFLRDALLFPGESGDAGALRERAAMARTKLRVLIDGAEIGWRPRLEALLWPPIEAAGRSVRAHVVSDAGEAWCAEVYRPFHPKLAGHYPFRAGGDDAALADLGEFFRPGGALWTFYDEKLKDEVPRAGRSFQFAKRLGTAVPFRPELRGFLESAQLITDALFPGGSTEPKVEFSVRIRPTPGVAVVWLEVDGQRLDYRNGPEEWHRLTWPGPNRGRGAYLRVRTAAGREESFQQDGEWGLFRLLEAGAVKGQPGTSAFTASWALPTLNASVVVDFKPDRSETPFFGARYGARRFLAPFRTGGLPPGDIGGGGGGCR
jgi:type VI secretion system protein ImpL